MSDNENVQIIEDQDTEMIDASAETKTEPGLYKMTRTIKYFTIFVSDNKNLS